MQQQQEVQVDANAVIAGLLDRLAARELEAVQLRVLLGQQERELEALRAASGRPENAADGLAELTPQSATHTLPRSEVN